MDMRASIPFRADTYEDARNMVRELWADKILEPSRDDAVICLNPDTSEWWLIIRTGHVFDTMDQLIKYGWAG